MAKYYTGIASIEIGEIAVDGGEATTYTNPGNVYKDSAEFTQAAEADIEHTVEEFDDPIVVVAGGTKTTIKWGINDFTASVLASVLGGTASGTAPNDKWVAPDTVSIIEKSVKITTKSGHVIRLPRVALRATLGMKLAKGGIGIVSIEGKVLNPTKAGVAPIIVGADAA
jgi:hypothetical protein